MYMCLEFFFPPACKIIQNKLGNALTVDEYVGRDVGAVPLVLHEERLAPVHQQLSPRDLKKFTTTNISNDPSGRSVGLSVGRSVCR